MNDSLLSRTISYLRFPLIVGVVLIHSNMLVVNIQGNMVRYDQWPVTKFVMTLFSSVFADISVPLFFFISGFLFFYNTEFSKETYINKIKKRIRTLLVPYLIWNFVAFIILLIEVHPKVIQFFPLLKDYRVDIVSFLSSFWVTNLPMSMYYMVDDTKVEYLLCVFIGNNMVLYIGRICRFSWIMPSIAILFPVRCVFLY